MSDPIDALPDGKIVWLEKGSSKIVNGKEQGAGLEHILKHAPEFESIGVSAEQIPSFLMRVINEGKVVNYQGQGTGRAIYQTQVNGQPRYVAITVGDNGFIVGANPSRGFK